MHINKNFTQNLFEWELRDSLHGYMDCWSKTLQIFLVFHRMYVWGRYWEVWFLDPYPDKLNFSLTTSKTSPDITCQCIKLYMCMYIDNFIIFLFRGATHLKCYSYTTAVETGSDMLGFNTWSKVMAHSSILNEKITRNHRNPVSYKVLFDTIITKKMLYRTGFKWNNLQRLFLDTT